MLPGVVPKFGRRLLWATLAAASAEWPRAQANFGPCVGRDRTACVLVRKTSQVNGLTSGTRWGRCDTGEDSALEIPA